MAADTSHLFGLRIRKREEQRRRPDLLVVDLPCRDVDRAMPVRAVLGLHLDLARDLQRQRRIRKPLEREEQALAAEIAAQLTVLDQLRAGNIPLEGGAMNEGAGRQWVADLLVFAD